MKLYFSYLGLKQCPSLSYFYLIHVSSQENKTLSTKVHDLSKAKMEWHLMEELVSSPNTFKPARIALAVSGKLYFKRFIIMIKNFLWTPCSTGQYARKMDKCNDYSTIISFQPTIPAAQNFLKFQLSRCNFSKLDAKTR